jgi:RES domain-containing protein
MRARCWNVWLLVVPLVVARRESKVFVNPRHPDFSKIVASAPEPVAWDARLFAPR